MTNEVKVISVQGEIEYTMFDGRVCEVEYEALYYSDMEPMSMEVTDIRVLRSNMSYDVCVEKGQKVPKKMSFVELSKTDQKNIKEMVTEASRKELDRKMAA